VSESCCSARVTDSRIEATLRRALTRSQYTESTSVTVSEIVRSSRACEALRSADATRIPSLAGSMKRLRRSGCVKEMPTPVWYEGERSVKTPLVVARPQLVKRDTAPPVGSSCVKDVERSTVSLCGASSLSGAPEKAELTGSWKFREIASAFHSSS